VVGGHRGASGRRASDGATQRVERQDAAEEARFIPALRFDFLTQLFDSIAAVTVRDRAIKRRVLTRAAIDAGEQLLDVGCGTGTLAVPPRRPRAT
jgi:2-polyprenyl-3-methyl-5-hydroxy-6-metoxy-1,4-benzoquinol methylase